MNEEYNPHIVVTKFLHIIEMNRRRFVHQSLIEDEEKRIIDDFVNNFMKKPI